MSSAEFNPLRHRLQGFYCGKFMTGNSIQPLTSYLYVPQKGHVKFRINACIAEQFPRICNCYERVSVAHSALIWFLYDLHLNLDSTLVRQVNPIVEKMWSR